MAIRDVIDANIVPNNNANFITGARLNTTLKAMCTDYEGADSAETLARQGADTTLQGNIDAEALARGNADTALGTRLTAAEGNITSLGGRVTTAEGDIEAIEGKIPAQATSANQLADKAFVNSSINSVTAYYITSNPAGDAFATKAALLAGPYYNQGQLRTPTRNDYALVIADETKDNASVRYVFDGTNWAYQYKVNDTPFTASQLAAINSGATSAIIGSVAGKYVKPATGIPSTDLAEAVRTSLGKADTALQEHQSLASYRTSANQDVIDAGKADKTPIVNPASASSYALAPDTLTNLGILTGNIVLTLTALTDATKVHIYDFIFVAGASVPTITYPSGISWLGGSAPTLTAGKTYEVSIMNNLAVAGEF